jgi:hypothetical protein
MILYTLTPDVRRNGRAFDTKYLDVHPSTGKIVVAAPLNQVAGRSLHYVLQATDLGGSPAGKSTSLPMIVRKQEMEEKYLDPSEPDMPFVPSFLFTYRSGARGGSIASSHARAGQKDRTFASSLP